MESLCTELARLLLQRGWMLATAESCTGGLIAATCTDLSGSSRWFDRGFVTYSNAAKAEMLGVDPLLIDTVGAVSEPVARAMAEGAVRPAPRHHASSAPTHVSLAVTGVAGPTGGTPEKPVGMVWFAWHVAGQTSTEVRLFDGNRAAVREQTTTHALAHLVELLQQA